MRTQNSFKPYADMDPTWIKSKGLSFSLWQPTHFPQKLSLKHTVWISVSIIFGFWQIWVDWPILSWIYFNDFLIWALISEIYGSKKCHFIVIYGAFIEQNLWKWNLEGLQSQAIVGFHKGVKHYTKQCSLIMCLLLPQRYLIMFANFRLFSKYY